MTDPARRRDCWSVSSPAGTASPRRAWQASQTARADPPWIPFLVQSHPHCNFPDVTRRAHGCR